jgi:predicted nucleotidyltransferase component of viral defense system
MRKLRAGNAGRFSTDLDFSAPDVDTGELLLDTIDGAELFDVRFTLTDRETMHAGLVVTTPNMRPSTASLSRREDRQLKWGQTLVTTLCSQKISYQPAPPPETT